ncbi:SusC/RagA family TonB-linked outer membrane protein [Olivibacter ginsenosidimutans]|uniref:SusC/RagA family TonB-linked outer membrane protein n=2 Tax=Olivibacter ginsenosidimutans TaxID=1176537 RepID=A0ABP9ARW2_9SPHI
MRLTTITTAVLLTTLQLAYSAGSRAQGVLNKRASLAMVNQTLSNVLKELNKQTHVEFVYSSMAETDKAVSIRANNEALSQILRSLLNHTDLGYEVVGNQVVIKKGTSTTVRQQPIRGRVTSTNGETLPGVNVTIKGTKTAVTTNIDGNYAISASANGVLVFRMLGYIVQEIPISGKSTINVVLQESISELSEVVVNTGYQSIDRKLFTGSTDLVKAVDAERPGVPDATRMLEGKVAGLSIQNVSGSFGAAPKIRVRGATSLSGDNRPLWVIDGIIMEDMVNVSNEQLTTGDPNTLVGSTLAGLNPNDIESFQILKDAAATAMYGARAMNGVIVVTTKKGKDTGGKAKVSYSGNFTSFLKPDYSQYDIMNSADQMAVYLEMRDKGWLDQAGTANARSSGVFGKMYNALYDYDETSNTWALKNNAVSEREFLTRYANANTNWFDVLFKNSLLQEHSVDITSGTENSQLYFSTSYLNDGGWTIADHVQRYTGNVRGNFKLSPKVDIGLIATGSIRDQRSPGSQTRSTNVVTGEYSREFDINPFSYSLNTSRALTAYDSDGNLEYFTNNYAPFNIINELDNNQLNTKVIDFKMQGEFHYKIIDHLKYDFAGSYRYVSTQQETKVTENSNMAQAYRAVGTSVIIDGNRYLYIDYDNPDAQGVSVLPYGGFYNTTDNNIKNYYIRNSLNWSQTFNEDHMVDLYGVTELRYIDRQNKYFDGVGYQYNAGGTPYVDPNYFDRLAQINLQYYGMGYDHERYLAYSLRGAYSYKEKYSINSTIRYDGSNLMGRSTTARWLPTWNVSGAWNIDQEAFFRKQNIMSQARLRATRGLTASLGSATNSSMILRNVLTTRPITDDRENSIELQNLENSELTWEKMYETNIGADLGFFNDRLKLTADIYWRNQFDLIGAITTAGIGGESVKQANYADMQSRGQELTINGSIIRGKDWKWNSQFNFAHNKTKITKLENLTDIWNLVKAEGGTLVGYPVRGLFSIKFDGLDPSNGVPLFTDENGETNQTAVDMQSNDIDNLVYEGSVDPTFTGGFFNTVSYKNLTLSALVTFSAGNVIRMDPIFKAQYSDLDATSKSFLNRWMIPGDELKTNVPAIASAFTENRLSGYPYNNYNYSDARVASGDFIRMKQVMLTYGFPQRIVKALGIGNASVSAVANNLFLFYSDSKLNGQDPEFYQSGGVAYPVQRQFSLSLRVGF